MTMPEHSLARNFEKPPIRMAPPDFARNLGDAGCLLAATIATETRIPLFTRGSDDTLLREQELAFFFEGMPEQMLRSYASPTNERTAAIAVYRRTRHTVATEHPKSYEQAERELYRLIRDLGVLTTAYTFAAPGFTEASKELAASSVIVEAEQSYVPSRRSIYNLQRGPLAVQLGGSYEQPDSIATRDPRRPLNLFAGEVVDITEFSPVFRRQPITRYTEPVFE